jgi:hypothetical protein
MKNTYSTLKKYFVSLAVILTVAVLAGSAGAQTAQQTAAAEFSQTANTRLEGTWQTTVTFEDDFALKVLFTFMPGRDETEGTLIDQNEYQLTPGPVCTADQGVWKKTDTRTYIATHFAFCFDADAGYEPAGSVKVRDAIEINLKGTAFTGRQFIEIFDTEGKLVDEFEADMEGTRVSAQAPPAASLSPTRSRSGQMFRKHYRLLGRSPKDQ